MRREPQGQERANMLAETGSDKTNAIYLSRGQQQSRCVDVNEVVSLARRWLVVERIEAQLGSSNAKRVERAADASRRQGSTAALREIPKGE